jgi:hypothetical protein
VAIPGRRLIRVRRGAPRGVVIPTSKPEQRVAEKAKDAAAPLVDEVKDAVQESAEHLREPAEAAVDTVKDRVRTPSMLSTPRVPPRSTTCARGEAHGRRVQRA